MIAHYGYLDGSGEFFIRLDTDKCDGCGDCVLACQAGVFEVLDGDPNDPFRDTSVAVVKDSERKKIKYVCGSCKPAFHRSPLPCVAACKPGAITLSW